MKTKNYILIIATLFYLVKAFGQDDNKVKKYQPFDGLVSDLAVCFDCSLDTMIHTIKQRIIDYPIDVRTEFIKQKGDTLIEIVSFNENGQPDYSYYYNNLLKIHYTKKDSNEFTVTVMNDFEMEKKKWNVSPKEFHLTDYDENSKMSHYYTEIYRDNLTKVEFEKKWKNGKFYTGQSKTYKKEGSEWTIQKIEKVDELDWPTNTTEPIKNGKKSGFTDLQKINLASYDGEFNIEQNDWLETNDDSTFSFLPLKLKDGLESGVYHIHKNISKKWTFHDLLIDANILNGKLHGVYNEYDLKTGKIKIYCNYTFGKLDGKRTIYSYNESGEYNGKKTELWIDGKFIDWAH